MKKKDSLRWQNFIIRSLLMLFVIAFLSRGIFAQTKKEWVQIGERIERNVLVKVIESDVNRTVVEFQVGGYYIERLMINDSPYVRISLPEATPLMEKGFPDIPKGRRNIIIPNNARMEFKIIESKKKEINILPIAPSKGHLERDINPDKVPYTFDDFYQQDAWYPETSFSVGEPFILRDHRGLTIQYSPFQYNPVQKLLRINTKLTVEISAIGPGERNIKERKAPLKLTPVLSQLYKRRFINFNFVSSRYTPVEELGRLLVVVYDDFASDVEDFIEWKIRKGIPTITARYPTDTGTGTANLQNYIQNIYDSDEGLTYIILVGDNEQIPTMTGSHAQAAPSDPMYVKLEGDDDYPDAFISRISTTSSADVSNQTTKFIYYERFPDTGTAAEWYHRGTGIASDQGNPKDWERCNELRTKLLNYGYSLVDQIYDPGAADTDVTNALDGGRSIINYLGHGGSTDWATTGFDNNDIDGLNNGNDLPFIIDVACMNGNFTRIGGDCFAERWLKTGTPGSPRGAIGIYASSRNADWVPPCVMQAEAIDLLVTEQSTTLGGLCFNGVMEALDEYAGDPGDPGKKLMEQYNLFGDCTLEVRTKSPETFTVVHVTSAPIVNNNFVVAVKKDSVMIPDAKVTLTKNGQIVGCKLTANTYPDKGTAKFSYNLSSGPMTICVTKPNYVPYVGACQLESYAGELWVSLHGGVTKPYDEWYEDTFCFNSIIDFEYRLKLKWAIVLELAYNDFKWYEPEFKEHFPWWNISATVRYYYPIKKFRPYIDFGPGLYIPDEGNSRFGVKFGLGIGYTITDRIVIEVGTDYHNIFPGNEERLYQDRKTSFQHFHAGVIFRLK